MPLCRHPSPFSPIAPIAENQQFALMDPTEDARCEKGQLLAPAVVRLPVAQCLT
jgi:hypothetical protein